MRKSSLATNLAFFVFGVTVSISLSAMANEDTIGVKYNTDVGMNEIWAIDSVTGASRLLKQFTFPSSSWNSAGSYVDPVAGKLYLQDASGKRLVFDIATNEIQTTTQPSVTGLQASWVMPQAGGTGEVIKNVTDSTGASVSQLGTDKVVASNGTTLVSADSNGAIHIGEHSLVTIEQNGAQQLYAADASGNAIPINITNGSDLKVNGVSVMGSISSIQSNGTTYLKTNSTGAPASATGVDAVALGGSAKASAPNSVALGAGSVADEADTVSVGSSSGKRRITNVAAGVNPSDAVNVAQLQSGLNQALSQANSYTDNQIGGLRNYLGRRANSGVAAALATSGIPQAFSNGKVMIGVGFGNWRGASGAAVGASAVVSEHVAIKGAGTFDDQGGKGFSGGIGFQF
jgi:autotransporter adhesin